MNKKVDYVYTEEQHEKISKLSDNLLAEIRDLSSNVVVAGSIISSNLALEEIKAMNTIPLLKSRLYNIANKLK